MTDADRPATEPRTEAGRRLVEMLPDYSFGAKTSRWQEHLQKYVDQILAIEAEAAQGAAPLDSAETRALAEFPTSPMEGMDDLNRGYIQGWNRAILTARGAAPRAEGLDDEYDLVYPEISPKKLGAT